MIRLRHVLLTLLVIALAGCAGTRPGTDTSNKQAFRAADTSRTIDLTRPPHDMWDRIRRGFAIPNLHTDLTEHWTNYYASHPEALHRMSERAGKYLYHIVDELENRGLPTELALLPFIESAYDPTALSRSKASGLWQFIPSTGRHFNLQQDWWMDQRRDPIASTAAALEYLAYLYDFQGDWYLALASYNWGEGAVRRAIAKNEAAGLGTDYLSLKLPDETRNYVPKLQAIKNIIADPHKYSVVLPSVSNTPYFTVVRKQRNIDIEVAAALAEMPVDELKALNASHNLPVIIAERDAHLLLPTDRVSTFRKNLSTYEGKLSAWTVYRPKQGESYASIAKEHGLTLAELRKLNGLRRNHTKARANMALIVPDITPTQGGVQLASLDAGGTAPTTTAIQQTQSHAAQRRPSTVRTHTVRRGDTLYALARRYNTTVAELRKLNNLKGDHLALGKRLRVPGADVRG